MLRINHIMPNPSLLIKLHDQSVLQSIITLIAIYSCKNILVGGFSRLSTNSYLISLCSGGYFRVMLVKGE